MTVFAVLMAVWALGATEVPDVVTVAGAGFTNVLKRSGNTWRGHGVTAELSEDGRVSIAAPTEELIWMRLDWKQDWPADARCLADAWERTYGDHEWKALGAEERISPWYFLVNADGRTDGYGVGVQPNAFACWVISRAGYSLRLDLRAGSEPVCLGGRKLEAVRIVRRTGARGESAFQAGCAFCRMMCPVPRLPKEPVYGYNDWYCAYGQNSATNFLSDAAACIEVLRDPSGGSRVTNRPFLVADDGWQFKGPNDESAPGLRWASHNAAWGLSMDVFAERVKALDARPGLWYRPFVPDEGWRAGPIDPTDPKWARQIREEMKRFVDWGFELVKIDFITYDWNHMWGLELGESPVKTRLPRWRDRTRTTAEVIRGLYAVMREAAGDHMYIIGCNAIDHFAAGLFEVQRTGDDTSGREWERTRKMGPNTLAMRAIHNGTFYQVDADCVGLASPDAIPWRLNAQWLDLVARSGTALFVSWKKNLLNDDVRVALREGFIRASHRQTTAEPLDWFSDRCPRHWRFSDGEGAYDWSEASGLKRVSPKRYRD